MTICVHMLARNSDDFIRPCLESVLPYATRVLVTLDARSSDKTEKILYELSEKYKNLEITIVNVVTPERDLVKFRNEQIKETTEDWIWIVDSDEYYPRETTKEILEATKHSQYDTIALNSWALWNKEEYHVSTTRIPSARLFRKDSDMQWEGKFGKEMLYAGYIKLWDKDNVREEVKVLENCYIHFTHMKKDSWRKEMNQERRADSRNLRRLPLLVLNEIKKIYETV